MNAFCRIIYILLLLLGVQTIIAQNLKPQFDTEQDLYGVISQKDNRIILPPKYLEIVDIFDDKLIIVRSLDSKYGVIDTSGRVVCSFSDRCPLFYRYDSMFLGRLIESPLKTPYFTEYNKFYFVDNHRRCIPEEYYPCPPWKGITKDSLSKYIHLIHDAKGYLRTHKIDSAILLSNQAIKLTPKKPYGYYARAELTLYNDSADRLRSASELLQLGKYEIDSIKKYLEKADSLENRPVFNLMIKNTAYDYYKYVRKNRTMQREIIQQSRKDGINIERSGAFLISSASVWASKEIEAGLASGYLTNNNRISARKVLDPQGVMIIGLSWTRNLTYNWDAYKLYLFSFTKPFSFGIYPIFYTTYTENDLVLRPEIGIGYGIFSLNIGYNLHVAGAKFDNINQPILNLRLYLPLRTSKAFQQVVY